MVERTSEERAAAVEAMCRVRAVESPANPSGHRTIWHRSARGAELISELDADGRVTRQELRLFDEVLVWVAGVFRTGAGAAGARAGRPAEAVEWDAAPSPDRLARISSALSGYRGADRLIAHVRGVLGLRDGEVPGAPAPGSTPGPAALEAASRREADREAARRRSIGTMGLVGGAALTLLGVLLAWRSSCG